MSIKANNVIVIDDNKNISNTSSVTFKDNSVQTSAINEIKYIAGTLIRTIDNPELNERYEHYVLNDSDKIEYNRIYSRMEIQQYGWSVGISNNYAIIGGGHNYWDFELRKAYIFNTNTGQLLYTLINPNPNDPFTNDNFGWSVSISDTYAVVGARGEAAASGKVYVYNLANVSIMTTISNPNAYSTGDNDNFGHSVSIFNNNIVVGAPYEDAANNELNSGKAYIFNANGSLTFTLNNPNAYSTGDNDNFGYSVAISNQYAAVSAYVEDDTSGTQSGKVYIYNANTGSLIWTLSNPNAYSTSAGDYFGISVAISDNYAIIGASYEDDTRSFDSGKAYVYNLTTGSLVWTLNNPNGYSASTYDNFGYSVGISGNTAVVGAYGEGIDYGTISGNITLIGNQDSGKAYIYDITNGALVKTIKNPSNFNAKTLDNFGYSVAIANNNIIIGAPGEDSSLSNNLGSAYIFNANTSFLKYTLSVPEGKNTSNYYFGGDPNNSTRYPTQMAISEDYAIIASPSYPSGFAVPNSTTGRVWIFEVSTGKLLWTFSNPFVQRTDLEPFLSAYIPSNYGQSVAISKKYALVGAWGSDQPYAYGNDSGVVYVYDIEKGKLHLTIKNPNAYSLEEWDRFGYAIAIDGNYAVIGAPEEDDPSPPNINGFSAGKAYVYDVSTGILMKVLNNPNSVTYTTLTPNDNFGKSVSLSGRYAIIGAPGEEDFAPSGPYADGRYFQDSGRAYLFDIFTGQLIYTFSDPNVYSSSSFYSFGLITAISDKYIVLASPFTREPDISIPPYTYFRTNSGRVYVYNLKTGALIHTLYNPSAYAAFGNPAGQYEDQFGTSVAISPDSKYLAVSAPFEDDPGGFNSGKVYVYNLTTGSLVWTLDNSNAYSTSDGDYFGYNLAINNNYLMIGSNEDDSSGLNSGKVYTYALENLYEISGIEKIILSNNYEISQDNPLFEISLAKSNNFETLVYSTALQDPNPVGTAQFDQFGFSIDMNDKYLVVGTPYEDSTTKSDAGKVYVYNVTTDITIPYKLLYTLDDPNVYSSAFAGYYFGWSVAISSKYIAVGAPGYPDSGGTVSGKAFVYDIFTGNLIFVLNNPNTYSTSASDYFGNSIAITNDYVIVGAPEEDSSGGSSSGKAYIFNLNTGTLVWTINNPNAYVFSNENFENFGGSMCAFGDYVAISAYGEDDSSGGTSGKVYIFYLPTGGLLTTLNNPNSYSTSASDYFGWSVAISNKYCIVGAPFEDNKFGLNGAAYVFDIFTGNLVRTILNPNINYDYGTDQDYFGGSVAVDGEYCVITAPYYNIGGYIHRRSGRAYVYHIYTGKLLHIIENPDFSKTSNASLQDYFGGNPSPIQTSVKISNGYIAISASNEDYANISQWQDSGVVYIFSSLVKKTLLDKLIDYIDKY